MDEPPAVPRAVSAISSAVHNDLQGRYTADRKTLCAEDALVSSLRSKMSAKDYQAVEGFFNGAGSDEAGIYGLPIHYRLLTALERQDATALAVATAPWSQVSATGNSPPANRSRKESKRRRVIGGLVGLLCFGLLYGGIYWYGSVSYNHWARACHREGGIVQKTGTSSGGGGLDDAAWSSTKYVCLGPDGQLLSHHETDL